MPILVGPPLPPAPVATLADAFERLAAQDGDWLTLHRGSTREPVSGRALVTQARQFASALQAVGVRPGNRVLVLLPNGPRFIAAFFGAILAGATPVPLPWPAALTPNARTLGPLAATAATADARAVITEAAVGDPGFGVPIVTEGIQGAVRTPSIDPDSAAFVQFTSGSLGRPKGAVISHRAAVACAWSMGTALGLSAKDVGVSWLPAFHDMGLVGALLCPLLFGFPVHLSTPGEFLLHPRRWLERISQLRGTVSAGPDFAYDLLARRVTDTAGLDLSSWRFALNGSEPVHRRTIEAFNTRFSGVGFHSRADDARVRDGREHARSRVCRGRRRQ